MDDKYFDYWIQLECEVASEIGHGDLQISTSGSLADNFIEDCDSLGFSYAVYHMKWLLVYHWQSVGKSVRRFLADYPEIDFC